MNLGAYDIGVEVAHEKKAILVFRDEAKDLYVSVAIELPCLDVGRVVGGLRDLANEIERQEISSDWEEIL